MGVRSDEVASVSEKAYKSLPAPYCMQQLMLSSQAELNDYAEVVSACSKYHESRKLTMRCELQRGWEIKDNTVFFQTGGNEKKEVPATETISEMLHYAKELERIV